MAEVVVGTPAIAGFTNGFSNNDLGLGLSSLLLAQAMERGHCELVRDINKGVGDNHVATIEAQRASEMAILGSAAETRQILTHDLLELERIASANATEAARCCCEIKALIIEKANSTDALIRQIDADNAKQALQDAKNELLAIKYSRKES